MEPSARHVILVLALAGALLLVQGCGGGDEDRLTASPTRIEFGRMLHGDVSERTLTLTNRGPVDVSITHVSANCSCIEHHPFGRLLHPGEERTLTIFLLSGAVGTGPLRGKHLDIVSSDPIRPHLQVELGGEIVQSITVLPVTLELGTLGAPPSLETQLVRVRPGPGMEVELVRYRGQPQEQLEIETVEVDAGVDFSVRWKPPVEHGRGRFLGSLEIRTRVSGAGFEPRELKHVVRIQGEWPRR